MQLVPKHPTLRLSRALPVLRHSRRFTDVLPRPPPPSPLPPPEMFSAPSKHPPGQYYHRRQPRDLPPYRRAWPTLLLLSAAGVGVWVTFLAYSANQERISSSAMRLVVSTIKNNPEVRAVLGDAVRPEPAWYLNGDPWVSGSIKMHQGNIDLSFRVKGHKGAGTLYYTSIRRAKGEPFTTLRFKIIADSGPVIHLPPPTSH